MKISLKISPGLRRNISVFLLIIFSISNMSMAIPKAECVGVCCEESDGLLCSVNKADEKTDNQKDEEIQISFQLWQVNRRLIWHYLMLIRHRDLNF